MIDKEALLERLDLFICEYDRMDQGSDRSNKNRD